MGSSTALEGLLAPVRRRLGELMRSEAIEKGDIDAALKQLTEVAAATLKVERASVWLFDEDRSRLLCVDLFERAGCTHGSGNELTARNAPAYFEALATERSIAAHDARKDPRTCEFTTSYLEPLGIGAMLDAPVFVSGRLAGVVCHEHIGGTRTWEPWEELLAGTFGDFVSIVLGASARATQTPALLGYRSHLESLVELRTKELTASEARFHMLFEASPVALIMSRAADSTVAAANARAASMFGVEPSNVQGQHAPDFWADPEQRSALLKMLAEGSAVDSYETKLKKKDGSIFWADVSARVVGEGKERAVIFGVRDISAQKAAEDQLRLIATTDALTGAFNRRRIFEVAVAEVERAHRYGRPLAVAMLDLDHFKSINDRFGHAAGDAALREATSAVRAVIRSSDLLGRYGGEELMLVMPETNLDEAAALLERARAGVQAIVLGPTISLTVSAGLAALQPGEELDEVLHRADEALYAAKQGGRNRVTVVRATA